jgi:hypothetical protein
MSTDRLFMIGYVVGLVAVVYYVAASYGEDEED